MNCKILAAKTVLFLLQTYSSNM